MQDILDLKILHVDMDAFYASVEEADDENLKGKPVIVGGLSSHGVVTTCNYEARKYGIHSAMPGFMARSLCPHGFFLRPRMNRYREVSKEIFNILYDVTDLVEQISVDEAYLDISNIERNPLDLVGEIKDRVYRDLGLTLSVGLSYNKFLAKLASDWNKPNGFKYITRDMLPEILLDLNISKVHGIGPKSQKKLRNIGIYTVGDLYQLDENFLTDLFGKAGREIYLRIRGEDPRPVNNFRERKSIGIERTFDEETRDIGKLKEYLKNFSKKLEEELLKKQVHTKTIIVKVKDEDFRTQTRSKTLENHIYTFEEIYEVGLSLLDEIEINKKIRLLGITGASLLSIDLEQLSLFD